MGAERSISDIRYLYFIEFQASFVKVGIADDVKARLEQFRLGCPRGLSIRGSRAVPGCFTIQVERQVHAALNEWADGREWFRLRAAPAREIAQPIVDASWEAHRLATEAGVLYPKDRDRLERLARRLERNRAA